MKKNKIVLAWMQNDKVPLEWVKEMILSCKELVVGICYQYNGIDEYYKLKLQTLVKECCEGDFESSLFCSSYNAPWDNFAKNRNELLKFTEQNSVFSDYILFMDADETLIVKDSNLILTMDSYDVPVTGDLGFSRRILYRLNKGFYYRGSCHEFLDNAIPNKTIGTMQDYMSIVLRPKIGNAHIVRNAFMLSNAIFNEVEDDFLTARYLFYLGQSYFDLGYWLPAIDKLQERIAFKGWNQELYICHMSIGKAFYELYKSTKNDGYITYCIVHLNRAILIDPERLEAYYYYIKILCDVGRYEDACAVFEKEVKQYEWLPSGLFTEINIYKYMMNFWAAIMYWRCGNNLEALNYGIKVHNHIDVDDQTWRQNYDNLYYYFGFDKMNDIEFDAFIKDSIATKRFSPIGKLDEFIFEMPRDYDGLGDHLLFSCLPMWMSQNNIRFFYSMRSQAKTIGTFDVAWDKPKWIHGISKNHGNVIMVVIHEMLQRRYMNGWYRSFPEIIFRFLGFETGFDHEYPMHATYDLEQVSDECREIEWCDIVLFDGNSKSTKYSGSNVYSAMRKIMHEEHETALPYSIVFEGLSPIQIQSCDWVPKNIHEYCFAIAFCKEFFCMHSGGALLAIALGRKPNVFIPKNHADASFIFLLNANYIQV